MKARMCKSLADTIQCIFLLMARMHLNGTGFLMITTMWHQPGAQAYYVQQMLQPCQLDIVKLELKFLCNKASMYSY